jgi:hypothetical protein
LQFKNRQPAALCGKVLEPAPEEVRLMAESGDLARFGISAFKDMARESFTASVRTFRIPREDSSTALPDQRPLLSVSSGS